MLRFAALFVALLIALPAIGAKPFWRQVEGDTFSVWFPGQAQKTEHTEHSEAGDTRMVNYERRGDDGTTLLVSVSDFDAATVRRMSSRALLDAARDGALGGGRGTLKSERALTLRTRLHGKKKVYPGRALEVALPHGGTLLVRLYMVENRLYQLMAQFDSRHDLRSDFTTLAQSFQLRPARRSSGTRPTRSVDLATHHVGIFGCASTRCGMPSKGLGPLSGSGEIGGARSGDVLGADPDGGSMLLPDGDTP